MENKQDEIIDSVKDSVNKWLEDNNIDVLENVDVVFDFDSFLEYENMENEI